MSLQVFLYCQFRGIERFVSATPASDRSFADRSLWISLLGELTPRAFLAEKGLSPLLAGYTGGGAFLLLLPESFVSDAVEFLAQVRDAAGAATSGQLELHWSWTENLGPWPHIWKRLRDGLTRSAHAPLAAQGAVAFLPPAPPPSPAPWQDLAQQLEQSAIVGWNPAEPLRFVAGEGKHQWPLGKPPEGIACPVPPAQPQALARTARGRREWGLLRCEIDHSARRLLGAASAEDFLFLAVLYKGLVAGELQRITEMPAHEGRVAIVYSGGADFAIAGAWDALLGVAFEFHRVFTLFAEDLPGGRDQADGVSLSAALTLARPGESLASVWTSNLQSLETVKSSGRDALALFGRVLDWPALKDAESLKSRMRKLREQFQCPPELFAELEDFYGEQGAAEQLASAKSRRRERSFSRPWRFHSRLRRLAGDRTGSEFERQWRTFLEELLGRGNVLKQLRPAGKVALSWAQLETGARF